MMLVKSKPKSAETAKILRLPTDSQKRRQPETVNERTIQTVYSLNTKVVKVTWASYASNAVPTCVGHMQTNQYGANVAEVFDRATGEVHAVIRRRLTPDGKDSIKILLERKVKEGE